MRAIAALAGALLLASSPPARADEVYLQSGRRIEGQATEQGDKVVITLESGHITVARDDVARIEKSLPPLVEAERREAALDPGDRKGLLALANFSRDHDLRAKERALLWRLIELEPDHAEARRRLGFVRTEAGWVERAELARREAAADVTRRQAELALAREQAELALAEAKLAEQRREQQEAERKEKVPPPAPAHAPYVVPPFHPGAAIFLGPHRGPWAPRMPPPQAPTPPFPINGVRDPRSYYQEALRR